MGTDGKSKQTEKMIFGIFDNISIKARNKQFDTFQSKEDILEYFEKQNKHYLLNQSIEELLKKVGKPGSSSKKGKTPKINKTSEVKLFDNANMRDSSKRTGSMDKST